MGARLEDLLLSLGRPGRFQLMCVAMLTYQYVFFIAYPTSMSFWLLGPPESCNEQNLNGTVEEQSTNETNVEEKEEPFVSFAMEWGYMCKKDQYIVRNLQTCYFLGNMLGGIIFGTIADKFGRKPVAFGTIVTAGLIGVVTYFTSNLYLFAILKLVQGILMQGYNSSSNCMKTEMMHNKYRSKVISIADAFGLSLPMFYLAGLAYFAGHWRYVELGLCVPLLMSFWTVWVVPESLRWQLKEKQRKQALVSIRKITKFNGITLPDNIEEEIDMVITEIDDQSKVQHNYNILDLFRTSRMACYCFIFAYSWFAWLLVNYGLMFSMGDLSGNVFINFVILGVVDLISRSSAFLILKLCETKTLTSIGLCTVGVLFLGIVVLKAVPGLEHASYETGVAATAFVITGRAFVGIFVVSTYLLLSEVFPTPLRATAYGVFAATGRIGALSAPQVMLLSIVTWTEFPYVVFGSVALTAGTFQLLLPATKNKTMPNTIEETLALHKKPNKDVLLQPVKISRHFDVCRWQHKAMFEIGANK